MQIPASTLEQLRSILRADAVSVVIGLLLSSAGIAGLIAGGLRRRGRDLQLISFGVFCLVYGARLLASTSVVPLALSAPPSFWRNFIVLCTYIIPIPGLLFWAELFDVAPLRKALQWAVVVQVAVSIVEIALHYSGYPNLAGHINNVVGLLLSLLGVGLVYFKLFIQKKRTFAWITLGVSMLFLIAAVANSNLTGMGWVRFWPGVEAVTFFLFNVALGLVTAERVFHTEKKLVTLESELDTARRIQLSILPREMPQVSGLEVSARYEPMTSVAGDFYDFLSVSPTKLGVLVADVSGHGVGAALIASMVKVGFASLAHVGDDPAALLKGLNEILCRQGLQGQFLTAAYVVFDAEADAVRYSGAAHPPVLVVRSSGEVQAVENNGLPLGLMPWADYTNRDLRVASDERVLLYTDGITEAAGLEDEFFGDKLLAQFLTRNRTLPAEQLAMRLVATVQQWASKGTERGQQDDLTVIAIDRR